MGVQRSPLWALGGDSLVLVVALIAVGVSHESVTGRQPNMPPIGSGLKRLSRGAGSTAEMPA
jgi:hypothetical protein